MDSLEDTQSSFQGIHLAYRKYNWLYLASDASYLSYYRFCRKGVASHLAFSLTLLFKLILWGGIVEQGKLLGLRIQGPGVLSQIPRGLAV